MKEKGETEREKEREREWKSMLRNLCSHTSSATTFFASAFPLSVTVAHKPSPCLAGARLSGVSLLNPGAGHAHVPLPEAFGW